MAENHKVNIELTAEDRASPQIRKIVNDINRLKEQLAKNFATARIAAPIVDPKALAYVEKGRKELQKLADGHVTWARNLARDGSMSIDTYKKMTSQLSSMNQTLAKTGWLSRGAGSRTKEGVEQAVSNYRKLFQQIHAYAHVWNTEHGKRETLIHRLGQKELSLESAVNNVRKRAFNERLSNFGVTSRLMTAHQRQELTAINNTTRERLRAQRIADASRRRGFSEARRSLSNAAGWYDTNFWNSPFFYTMMAGGAMAAGGRSMIRREADTQSAEIDTRIYAGLSEKDAADLRGGWARDKGYEFGRSQAEMLQGYTEAAKLGIPQQGSKQFTEIAVKAAAAFERPIDEVTGFLGNVNTIIGNLGENFKPDELQKVLVSLNYMAAKTATTPEKLMTFMQKGSGGASQLGMSQQAGIAFGAAATSAGIQPGSAGRFLDFLATRIGADFRQMTTTPEGRRSRDGKIASNMLRRLGYGSYAGLERARNDDPDNFLLDMIERFQTRITTDKERFQFGELLTGKEWFGEFGKFFKNPKLVAETRRLMNEAKGDKGQAQWDETWMLTQLKLTFKWKRIKSIWTSFLADMGSAITPYLVEASEFFFDWSKGYKGIQLREGMKYFLDGIIEGWGGRGSQLKDILKGFGDFVRGLGGTGKAIGEFSRGFTSGFKSVGKFFVDLAKLVGTITGLGGTNSEVLGKIIGGLIAFGLAMHFLRPVFAILSAIVGTITAMAGLTAGAMSALGVGAAGAFALSTMGLAGLIVGGALLVRLVNWDEVGKAYFDLFKTGDEKIIPKDELARRRGGPLHETNPLRPSGWDSLKYMWESIFGKNAPAKTEGPIPAKPVSPAEAKQSFFELQNVVTPRKPDAEIAAAIDTIRKTWKPKAEFAAELDNMTPKPPSIKDIMRPDLGNERPDHKWNPVPPDNGGPIRKPEWPDWLKRQFELQSSKPLVKSDADLPAVGAQLAQHIATGLRNAAMMGAFNQIGGHAGGAAGGGLLANAALNYAGGDAVTGITSGPGGSSGSAFNVPGSGAFKPGGAAGGTSGGSAAMGSTGGITAGEGGRTGNERTMNNLLRQHGSPWGSIAARSQFIKDEAAKVGIDPETALRVANTEGNRHKFGVNINAKEKSFGAFQLNTQGGEGAEFMRATGLDPSNPQNEPAAIRWALNRAKRNGWGAWYGARDNGIGNMQGIGQRARGPFKVTNDLDQRYKQGGGIAAAAGGEEAGSGGKIPSLGAYGLPIKGGPNGQALAGGVTHPGTLALAQTINAKGIPGGLNRFTAFNDRYHIGKGGSHPLGLAGDLTIKDPSKSAEAAEAIRNQFRAAGLKDNQFFVKDEYRSQSGAWTAPHLHYQFANQQAAAMYQQYAERQRQLAIAAQQQQQIDTSKLPTPQSWNTPNMTQGVPRLGPGAGMGMGGAGTSPPVNINIHGAGSDPEVLAQKVQRRLAEETTRRSSDTEYEGWL